MTTQKPQAKVQVKAPGSATLEIVEPGVTYAFNIVLDKAGSTAVAQFHLPLNMSVETMQAYTKKALEVIEMQQLRFDAQKLKVELKLSAAMIEHQKADLLNARKEREDEAKRTGNGRIAKPVNQQLIALDNALRQSMQRHDAMILDLASMEKKLGTVGANTN